jgi:phosphotriesterase-related protein
MPDVQTTAGPLPVSELGRTLVHEHLLSVSEPVRAQWPHLHDQAAEYERAVEQVRAAMAHGVQTICDPSCMDLGRDVRLNLRVAEATGVRFVMATGVYGVHYTFLPHYFRNREPQALVDAFVHDLQHGIQGTEVRAHFLKCAADEPGLVEDVERVHRAVAQASLSIGAPIMAHSHPTSRTGLAQMALFVEEGVDPRKVQIAHTGDTDDLDYIEELLATGCSIGLDRYGLDIFLPTAQRNATLVELCRRGHAERIMLGQDACATLDWFPPEIVAQLAPNWSFTFIFETVIPTLLELGVGQEQLDAMIGANVHAWLAA